MKKMTMQSNAILAIVFALVISQSAFSQDTHKLSGIVLDEKNREPLPYATIIIKGSTVGTMANAEGQFIFHVPAKYEDGLLVFSMLGYRSVEVAIKKMRAEEQVFLRSSPKVLRELVVTDLSGKQILKRAYRNRSKNYPTQPFQLEGYYRENQRANSSNVALTEAFVTVQDEGYDTGAPQSFYIKQLRHAESYINPVAPFWEKKNLLMAFVNQNFVKYNRSFHKGKVTRMEDTMIDSVLVYVLGVERKFAFWPSTVYIRSDNYAVIRTEEKFDAKRDGQHKWKVEDNPMMESYPQAKFLQINYKLVGDKYYPDNYRMTFSTLYKDIVTKQNMLTFGIAQQFVVTRVITDHLPPLSTEDLLHENINLKKVAIHYDSAFWTNSPIRDTPRDSLIRLDLNVQNRK